jgi:hypothetical protein
LDLSFIGKLGPHLPGLSGAGEGVHACLADSIATKILGFQEQSGEPSRGGRLATSARYWLFSPQGIDYSHA